MAFERVNTYQATCICCGKKEIFYAYTLEDAIEKAIYQNWICNDLKFSSNKEFLVNCVILCPKCADGYDE